MNFPPNYYLIFSSHFIYM